MSYCVNCGVELGDSEKSCPLCLTKVIHPGRKLKSGEALYPPHRHIIRPKGQQRRHHTDPDADFLLPTSIVAMADISINYSITWSGYVLELFLCCIFDRAPIASSETTRPLYYNRRRMPVALPDINRVHDRRKMVYFGRNSRSYLGINGGRFGSGHSGQESKAYRLKAVRRLALCRRASARAHRMAPQRRVRPAQVLCLGAVSFCRPDHPRCDLPRNRQKRAP